MKKRLLIILTIATLLIGLSAFSVSADQDPVGEQYWEDYMGNYGDHVDDDGIEIENDVDPNNPGKYTILNGWDEEDNYLGLNRTNAYYDRDPNTIADEFDQEVSVDMEVVAYIPCYLTMTITGNQGQTIATSYGPGAAANGSASTLVNGMYYHMIFDNEIGGFVDEDWNSLGHGMNAEIEPGSEVYIQSCDIFRVEVYGNEDYKYEVELTQPLLGVNPSNSSMELPMDMRTSIDDGANWSEFTFANPNYKTVIATMNAAEALTAYHNFRVPYGDGVLHGEYNGEITFRAATL